MCAHIHIGLHLTAEGSTCKCGRLWVLTLGQCFMLHLVHGIPQQIISLLRGLAQVISCCIYTCYHESGDETEMQPLPGM